MAPRTLSIVFGFATMLGVACASEVDESCIRELNTRDYFSILGFERGEKGLVVQASREVYELEFDSDTRGWQLDLPGNALGLRRADNDRLYVLRNTDTNGPGGINYERASLHLLSLEGAVFAELTLGIEADSFRIRGGFTNALGVSFVFGDGHASADVNPGWMAWIDEDGALLPSVELSAGERVTKAVETTDAGQVIAVIARDRGDGFDQVFLRRFGVDGVVTWNEELAPNDEGLSFALEPDGRGGAFLTLGYTDRQDDELRHVDAEGEFQWTRSVPEGSRTQRAFSWLPERDAWLHVSHLPEPELRVSMELVGRSGEEICSRTLASAGGHPLDILQTADATYVMIVDRIFKLELVP